MPPPFDWTRYLTLAKELGTRADDEAALRSAISRAYYAASNQARAYCAIKNIEVPKSRDSHQATWKIFTGRTLGGVHSNGIRLMRRRVQADYESEIERISDEVGTALHESENILHYLSAALGRAS